MKRAVVCLSIFLIITLLLGAFNIKPALASSDDGKIRVMIQYKPGQKNAIERAVMNAGAEMHYTFDQLNVLVVSLPKAALNGIIRNPNVVYVEEDSIRYLYDEKLTNPSTAPLAVSAASPYQEQVIPYGIDMVQARDVWDTNRDGVIDEGAHTGAGITVCIIDSGLYTTHEDFSGVNILGGYGKNANPWNDDGLGHGTHVAGTITAMNNTIGVVGVTPGTVNLYIVRVFGDTGRWVNTSSLVAALGYCPSETKIISMSLGGPTSSTTERQAFDSLYSQGVLSIAAAGNDGNATYSYPASYDSVISVAAIDSNKSWGDFSQYNNQVELAAPGVGVLSTVPFIETNTVVVDGVTYYANHFDYAARGTTSGQLVDGGLCGTSGTWTGKVVLCQRGTYEFSVKVANVINGGGVAALIYNNVPGNFLGTLGATSSLIALSLSQEDGQYLVANKLGVVATVTSQEPVTGSGYEAWDGTSMATPHVSGVAALVWSCKPTATNIEVRQAMTITAEDLGDPGRDIYYGYGLVQARSACNALNPTAVDLLGFTATGAKESVTLQWETAAEYDTLGYNLFRANTENGRRIKLNEIMIRRDGPPGSLLGASYEYIDTAFDVKASGLDENSGTILRQAMNGGRPYYYWLEEVDIYGYTEFYGPVEVITQGK